MNSRASKTASQAGARQPDTRIGLLAGLALLALIVGLDVVLGTESGAIVGAYVAPPFVTALIGGTRATAGVSIIAIALALASSTWNMGSAENPDYFVRLAVVVLGSAFAMLSAQARARARGRADRLRLLDAVGDVADGSLPLAETLNRVVEVVVPAVGDICMIDAVHDGRVTRIAVRARGREDAGAVEEGIRGRRPSLPAWLVESDRPWRHIPRWLPRMTDEDLRRISESPEDLEFLRSLGVRSSISAPVTARDRNLGALTLISAWSGRRYSADDLRFAQILASRVGLALDNAGLFSDLESVERRMDTVMSMLDEAVVIHGPEGGLLFANPAAARMLGFETSEQAMASPASIRDRFKIADERGRELGSDALSGRGALRGETSRPRTLRLIEQRTDRERWVRTKSRAIEGAEGEILYSVTAIEDVTDVKRAEFGQRLLARTGELIAHADSYTRMLAEVPRLIVPDFADWCAVSMPSEDGTIEIVAVAHQEPERERSGRRLGELYPAHLGDGSAAARVIESGEAELLELTPEELRERARDETHLELLEQLGLSSAIVAPMGAGGRVVGTLSFVNERGSRRFNEDDLALATEIGRRCAVAIESARVADERARVADALQRELLPPNLPPMPGWEVATMYEPAGELNDVGGDFYEVFEVERGWAVVLGDVSGRGAAAASLTAEARHTIRTAGSLAPEPWAGLRLLDENLRSRADAALCSVAMIVLPRDPEAGEAEIYLAGHPHPILLRDGLATEVGAPGPLLGVVEGAEWRAERVALRRGDQLVIFTDGVIEARGEGGDRYGSQRLCARLAGCATPAAAVERVRSGLVAFGAKARQDDAAVVAIRCAGYRIPATAGSRTASTTWAAS